MSGLVGKLTRAVLRRERASNRPDLSDQMVTFNVNGVFYNRLTDSNGQAALNIRLPPGEYIITSSFNGVNVANKITITG